MNSLERLKRQKIDNLKSWKNNNEHLKKKNVVLGMIIALLLPIVFLMISKMDSEMDESFVFVVFLLTSMAFLPFMIMSLLMATAISKNDEEIQKREKTAC